MASPATAQTRTNMLGAPDYDDPAFWDSKFATGRDVGEWLNSGEALLDQALHDLERLPVHGRPRVLHLGPGISQLGAKLRDEFVNRQWAPNGIVNVDFSAEAVRLGQGCEHERDQSQAMRWVRADLRSWDDVSSLTRFAPFDVILDKSTIDSIATSRNYTFSSTDNLHHVCPAICEMLPCRPPMTLSPVELVALHLVSLTQKGSTWIALSYSTTRFDDLESLKKYWTIRSRTALKAPSGPVSSPAYTPDIFHWMYILDRK